MSVFQREDGDKRIFTAERIIIVLLCVIVLLLLNGKCSGSPSAVGQAEDTAASAPVEKNKNSISVPGYEMLTLTAGETAQSLCLQNPAQNNCYFRISLYLSDGECLWKSGLIPPGAASAPIEPCRPLDAGTYPKSVLRYECFAMDEAQTALNGAETVFTLVVQ